MFYQLTFDYQIHVILYDLRESEVAQRINSREVFFIWVEDYIPSLLSFDT